MEPLQYLAGEFDLISKAPALFILSIAAASAVIWRLMEWKYSDAKERIALRDDKIKELETRLEQNSLNSEILTKIDLSDYLRKDEPIDPGTF